MFRKWFSYVPPQDDVQQKFTGVQEHTHQHPGLVAMKHPLFPVSGQEPVPCHPLVPSLPEDQSLGSSEPTQKETGGVFPMRVLPGSMLGKSYRAGSIYSERPFGRSGDIRSEPPCLWEFKISKAPHPPAKISTSLAQGRRALNLPACRLDGRQANGRRAMWGLRPSGAGRPRFSQTPTPAPNALVLPAPAP